MVTVLVHYTLLLVAKLRALGRVPVSYGIWGHGQLMARKKEMTADCACINMSVPFAVPSHHHACFGTRSAIATAVLHNCIALDDSFDEDAPFESSSGSFAVGVGQQRWEGSMKRGYGPDAAGHLPPSLCCGIHVSASSAGIRDGHGRYLSPI